MTYVETIIALVGINILIILGMFLITGMTGMFTLGHGAMVTSGAYITALLCKFTNMPVTLTILISVLSVGVVAALLGMVALNLRADYFVLATFGFSEGLTAVLTLATSLTGGANGLRGAPQVVNIPIVWTVVVAGIIFVAILKNGSFGRKCIAVRDDPLAADTLGIPVYQHKVIVFSIGSMMAALGGCLYVHLTSYVEPSQFGWMESAEWMIIIFFGGRYSLTGTVFSAIILNVIPEFLQAAKEWRTVVYCIIILIVLSFKPSGIFGEKELPLRRFAGLIKRKTMKGSR